MPSRYTIRDRQSGRSITFAWSGDAEPTETELDEIFASAVASADAPAGATDLERATIAASRASRLRDGVPRSSPTIPAPPADTLRSPDDPDYSVVSDYPQAFARGAVRLADALAALPSAVRDDPMGVARQVVSGVVSTPARLVEDLAGFRDINRTDPLRLIEDASLASGLLKAGTAAAQAGARRTGPVVAQAGERTIQSAFKPRPSVQDRNPQVNFPRVLAAHGANPTEGGLQQISTAANALRSQVGAAVQQAAQQGATGDVVAAIRPALAYLTRAARNPGVTRGELRQMAEQVRAFVSHPTVQGRTMPVDALQAGKVTFGRKTEGLRGQTMPLGPKGTVDALRYGSRQELERAVPGLADLNRQLGPLIATEDELAHALGRMSNHDLVSLTHVASGSLAGLPGAVAMRVGRLPAVKGTVSRHLIAAGDRLAQAGRGAPASLPPELAAVLAQVAELPARVPIPLAEPVPLPIPLVPSHTPTRAVEEEEEEERQRRLARR